MLHIGKYGVRNAQRTLERCACPFAEGLARGRVGDRPGSRGAAQIGVDNIAMMVRVAAPGDENGIADVHVRTWQAAYRGQVPDEFLDGLSVERRTEAWRRIIAESELPAKGAFVLERDGRIVGFAHVAPSRDDDARGEVGELTAIYLLPELWGCGAGRLLIKQALQSLRAAGFAEATLWVLETNVRARRFYEAGAWYPDGASKLEELTSFCMIELRYRRMISVE